MAEQEEDLKKMTFSEHFDELRRRLLTCIVTVVVAFIASYCFKDFLVDIVVGPYERLREASRAGGAELGELVFIAPAEKFIFYLKVCFLVSVFVSAPVILLQMWLFIAAGLYRHERRPVKRVMPLSMLLFLAGMLFGYFVLFPMGLDFLVNFGDPEKFSASITMSKYLSLLSILILLMGFVFQTPLVMVVTTKVGLASPELFSKKRKYFIVGAFILAALFTPPDWVTQCLLAVPLVVLFEVGILLSRTVKKGPGRRKGEGADA